MGKRELLINEYLSLGFFISENPLVEKRPFFKNLIFLILFL